MLCIKLPPHATVPRMPQSFLLTASCICWGPSKDLDLSLSSVVWHQHWLTFNTS